jgi:hypothetical protein
MNQSSLLTLKQEFLKISVSLQTAFEVETYSGRAVARRSSDDVEVTNVPSRNPKADYFEGRGATFNAIKVIY